MDTEEKNKIKEVSRVSLQIGKVNRLKVVKLTKYGAYLAAAGSQEEVLLPAKEIPGDIAQGEELEVFLYKDTKDRLVGTLREPKGQVGDLVYLEVVDTTPIGAFLDWGLDKDLLLPIKEQTVRVRKGKHYLVKIYVDKSQRLCATMAIDEALIAHSPFKAGDMVMGTVYGVNPRLGAFVAVENQYMGLVHQSEIYQEYHVGDQDQFRVIKVREDGKLDLSTKKLAYQQREEDAQKILHLLNLHGGFLPLNDKSDPKAIGKYLACSKNAFKRALGKLLKEGEIEQVEGGIRLLHPPQKD